MPYLKNGGRLRPQDEFRVREYTACRKLGSKRCNSQNGILSGINIHLPTHFQDEAKI